MFSYYLAVDLGHDIIKFDINFDSEETANDFADMIADNLVEFSFVQVVDKFVPPF